MTNLKVAIKNLVHFPYKFRPSIYFENVEIRDMVYHGYTVIYEICNESVHKWNGTHKDRMAWEIVVAYRNLEEAMRDGRVTCDALPQFSLISSGSAAIAIGRMLREFGDPALKVLSDVSLESNSELYSAILSSHCELYLISNQELTSTQNFADD